MYCQDMMLLESMQYSLIEDCKLLCNITTLRLVLIKVKIVLRPFTFAKSQKEIKCKRKKKK